LPYSILSSLQGLILSNALRA
jgi:molecular chaperone GrpE (heat shock protein)